MPDRRPTARRAKARQPQRISDPHQWIANLSNGRFHLALLVTLAAVSLIALGIPIARTRASSEESRTAPVLVAGDALAATVSTHGQTVAGALAQASVSPPDQNSSLRQAVESAPGAELTAESVLGWAGRMAARGALASPDRLASLLVQRQQAVSFTVHEDGFAFSQTSRRLTVGQALGSVGIKLGPGDKASPAPGAALTSGLHVYIQHAGRVNLSVGGQQQTVYTHAATVGGLLAEVGIELQPLDRVSPSPDKPVRNGMRVEFTRVRDSTEYVDEPLPFDSVYWDDPDLLRGDEELIQAGSDGYIRREYRVRYQNGVEVGRELIAESTVAATDQIIAQGSRVPTYTMATPEGDLDCSGTLTVYATWYTAASAGGFGRTATGTGVYRGIVAVDPRVIPLGTQMYIPGYGYGVAADTGGGVKGNMIDLGYGLDDVFDWSSRWVDICILG